MQKATIEYLRAHRKRGANGAAWIEARVRGSLGARHLRAEAAGCSSGLAAWRRVVTVSFTRLDTLDTLLNTPFQDPYFRHYEVGAPSCSALVLGDACDDMNAFLAGQGQKERA